jgi:predicted NAD/FAD-binding protein
MLADDRVSGTDADRHDDISHNGSSEFGGNADSADTADLVAPCKAWWGPGFDEQIFGADKQVSE